MHSRIFQISDNPIEKEDYLTEDHILENTSFLGGIADYVTEDTDREEDIEWLLDCLGGMPFTYNEEEQSLIFHRGFKEAYFRNDYDKFVEMMKYLTMEKFMDQNFVFDVNMLLDNKYGFYFYVSYPYGYYELMTMNKFVRVLREEEKYFLGGTLDYHS